MKNASLSEERLWHRCFPVNITKIFLRTPFLQKNLRETDSAFLFKLFSMDLLIFWHVILRDNAFFWLCSFWGTMIFNELSHYNCLFLTRYPYSVNWGSLLKLLSAIFNRFFIFHQMIALFVLQIFKFLYICFPICFSLSTIALEVDSRKILKFMMSPTV